MSRSISPLLRPLCAAACRLSAWLIACQCRCAFAVEGWTERGPVGVSLTGRPYSGIDCTGCPRRHALNHALASNRHIAEDAADPQFVGATGLAGPELLALACAASRKAVQAFQAGANAQCIRACGHEAHDAIAAHSARRHGMGVRP